MGAGGGGSTLATPPQAMLAEDRKSPLATPPRWPMPRPSGWFVVLARIRRLMASNRVNERHLQVLPITAVGGRIDPPPTKVAAKRIDPIVESAMCAGANMPSRCVKCGVRRDVWTGEAVVADTSVKQALHDETNWRKVLAENAETDRSANHAVNKLVREFRATLRCTT